MISVRAQTKLPPEPLTFVSSDMAALASHMDDCKLSRGRCFPLRAAADTVRGLVSSHIVSTGALLTAAGLVALLALG